jgi:succinoglycan biosynthesis protein ExoO
VGLPARPTISVIMANHQGGRYIESAIRSVLAQSLGDLELIVSDDASSDDSAARVAAIAARDPRVKLLRSDSRGGPASCRNRALDIARGSWIAIVDSDDLIHPERFARLLAAADQSGAGIVADDLLHFHEDGSPSRLLLPDDQQAPLEVTPVGWILAGEGGTPPLGYIKPLLRAAVLGDLRYDETLRIGEDYDLMLRLLLKGARLSIVPEPWYFYRRHDHSLSHRSSVKDLRAMIESQRRFSATAAPFAPDVAIAFERRARGLHAALSFEALIASLKTRNLGRAAATLASHPAILLRLAKSTVEHVLRPGVSPRRPASAATLVLSASADAMPGHAGAIVAIRVPPYRSPRQQHWTEGASRRKIWRRIADLSRSGTPKIVADGPAGLYAAGFIPAPLEPSGAP